jgi:hypothetical protein
MMKKILKRIAIGIMLILCVTFIVKTTIELGDMSRETGKSSLDMADDIRDEILDNIPSDWFFKWRK